MYKKLGFLFKQRPPFTVEACVNEKKIRMKFSRPDSRRQGWAEMAVRANATNLKAEV